MKSLNFLPKKLQEDELFIKVSELLDFIIQNNDDFINNVLKKYSNYEEVDVKGVEGTGNERGFDYILSLMGTTPDEKRKILYFIQLISILKDTKRGVLLISDILGASARVREWFETGGTTTPMTYELWWGIPTGYNINLVAEKLLYFLENYVYPKLAYWYIYYEDSYALAGGNPQFRGLGTQSENIPVQRNTYYNVGEYVIPSPPNGYHYLCIQAGTTSNSSVVWNITDGGTTYDGSVKWQTVLPGDLHGGVFGFISGAPDYDKPSVGKANQGWEENERIMYNNKNYIFETNNQVFTAVEQTLQGFYNIIIDDLQYDSNSNQIKDYPTYTSLSAYLPNAVSGDRVLVRVSETFTTTLEVPENVQIDFEDGVEITFNTDLTDAIIMNRLSFLGFLKININADFNNIVNFRSYGANIEQIIVNVLNTTTTNVFWFWEDAKCNLGEGLVLLDSTGTINITNIVLDEYVLQNDNVFQARQRTI